MLSGIIVSLYIAIAVGLLYVVHCRTRTIREQRDLAAVAARIARAQQRHGH